MALLRSSADMTLCLTVLLRVGIDSVVCKVYVLRGESLSIEPSVSSPDYFCCCYLTKESVEIDGETSREAFLAWKSPDTAEGDLT